MNKFVKLAVACATLSCVLGVSAADVYVAGLRGGIINATDLAEDQMPSEELTAETPYLELVAANTRTTGAGNWSTSLETVWTKNRCWVYWGEMWFDGGEYRFGANLYDRALVKIDGEVVWRSGNNTYGASPRVRPSRGWHAIEFRFSNANDANAGPRNTDVTWTTSKGFGVNMTCPDYESPYGKRYTPLVDDGTGSVFRHAVDGGETTATFDHDPVVTHTLAFAAGEGGSVSSSGGSCDEKGTLAVTATENAGYRFVKWTGDVAEGQTFAATVNVPGNRDRTLTAVFEPDAALSEKTYVGASKGSWSDDANWDPAGVPTAADAVTIPLKTVVYFSGTVDAGSLVLEDGACLSANYSFSAATPTIVHEAADKTVTDLQALRVRGGVTLKGASRLLIGGSAQVSKCQLEVGGDLSLEGTSAFAIYAGPTNGAAVGPIRNNEFYLGGARVTVGGETTVAAGCWIYPVADRYTGNPVVFDLRKLTVAEGGGFNAKGLGLWRNARNPANLDGNSWAGDGQWGGSHLGKGCSGVWAYDYPLAPRLPGHGGNAGDGGGVVRIFASDVDFAGTIDAQPNNSTTSGGGGGIWITADTMTAYPTTSFLANGLGSGRGGGGGGGIAIGLGLAPWQIDALYARGGAAGLVEGPINEILTDYLSHTVAFGTGPNGSGTDGTAVAYVNAAVEGKVAFEVAVDQDHDLTLAGASPAVGVRLLASGTTLTGVTLASPVVVSADGQQRRAVTGYTIDWADGTQTEGATSEIASLQLDQAARLTWHLDTVQYRCEASVAGDASGVVTVNGEKGAGWATDGSVAQLVATAGDADYEFQYWTGDVPYANRYDNPVSMTVVDSKSFTAFFGKKTGSVYTSKDSDGAWFDSTHWTPAGIPGTNDTAILSSKSTARKIRVPSFAAVGNIAVSNSILAVAVTDSNLKSKPYGCENYTTASTIDTSRTEPVGIDAWGDVLIDKTGFFYAGGSGQAAQTKVDVKGDLNIASGYLMLAAGAVITNVFDSALAADGKYVAYTDLEELFRGGNRLSVGGKTTIGAAGCLRPFCDLRCGAAMWLDLQDVTVATGGLIDAYEGGYNRFSVNSKVYTMCPGGLRTGDNKSAGSHGGRGGDLAVNSYQPHNKVYGFANAPFYPGYANGAGGIRGGGTIRMDCASLALNGTLKANGSSRNKGGSAGGGIWVNAGEITLGDSARVSAQGGSGVSGQGSGGGGGRIALCQGLSDEQMQELFASDEHICEGVSVSSLIDKYGATCISVAGGTGHASYTTGEDGTAVFSLSTAGKKMLTVAGDPENIGLPTPGYGESTHESGTAIDLRADAVVYLDAAERTRRVCGGFAVTNAAGDVIASGTGTTGSFTLTDDSFLTWDYTRLEHALEITSDAGGVVVTNEMPGAKGVWTASGAVSLTAVPDAGYAFVGWMGDVKPGETAATLAFTLDAPRRLRAVFAPVSAGARAWSGAGDGASWYDPANWTPEGLPGANEDVTLEGAKSVTADATVPLRVRSLTVPTGVTLAIQPVSAFSTMEKLLSKAVETDYLPTTVEVVSGLTVAGTLKVGKIHSLSQVTVAADAISIAEGGKLYLYAGYTDAVYGSTNFWAEGGAAVVANTISVATNAWIYPQCEGLSGSPVVFDVDRMTVSAGGGVNATARGWFAADIDAATYSRWPTAQLGNIYVGGAYGGISGSVLHEATAQPYGLALAPFYPGSSGGNGNQTGGGAIRIRATGTVRNCGTLIADGAKGWGSAGGGSGGGIWITCRRYSDAPGAVVSAQGGANDAGQAGGGGGRICIARGLTDAQVAELAVDGTCSKSETIKGYDLTEDEDLVQSGLKGSVSAAGGVSTANPATYPKKDGTEGTAWYLMGPTPGLMLIVR